MRAAGQLRAGGVRTRAPFGCARWTMGGQRGRLFSVSAACEFVVLGGGWERVVLIWGHSEGEEVYRGS